MVLTLVNQQNKPSSHGCDKRRCIRSVLSVGGIRVGMTIIVSCEKQMDDVDTRSDEEPLP